MSSKNFLFALLLLSLTLPGSVLAQTYLVGVPGVDNTNLTFASYINALYALAISIGALMAVIKIIIAGMKWMLSDVVTSKQEAISDIRGSVLGLLVVISAVVVLNQINPQLTETDLFFETLKVSPTPATAPTAGGTLIIEQGYRYTELPTSVVNFEGNCRSAGGLFVVENNNAGKKYEVCYDKISPAQEAWLQNQFAGLDLRTIQTRFQRYHFPRQRDTSSVILSNGSTTAYAVDYPPNGNWIERGQYNALRTTCADFGRKLNRPVYPYGSATEGFLACVY